ncbi:MAG: 16S rRNA (cytidine(1402)-2'-O)-methyltransferase [Pseudomonadota bacterium]
MSSNTPSEPPLIPVSGEIRKPTGEVQLTPGLYIVSTPIGNLRDITLRALDVLSGADEILAEDTRTARKLMTAYGIGTKLTAYHDHNGAARRPELLERLASGDRLALISDAGTPLVSDPGWKLVRDSLDAGLLVVPVPGASAMLTGLIVSGLPSDKFLFAGFLPPKSAARRRSIEQLADTPTTLIFFESAARLPSCLEDLAEVLGSDRRAAVARELTKLFEESRRDSLGNLALHYRDTGPPKGEIVVLVGPPSADRTPSEDDLNTALREALVNEPTKSAANRVATRFGLPKRDIYERALSLKSKTNEQ